MVKSLENVKADELRDSFGSILQRIQRGEFSEAETMAGTVLVENPNDPNILRLSGIALMRQSKYEQAAARSRQLSRRTWLKARNNLAWFLRHWVGLMKRKVRCRKLKN